MLFVLLQIITLLPIARLTKILSAELIFSSRKRIHQFRLPLVRHVGQPYIPAGLEQHDFAACFSFAFSLCYRLTQILLAQRRIVSLRAEETRIHSFYILGLLRVTRGLIRLPIIEMRRRIIVNVNVIPDKNVSVNVKLNNYWSHGNKNG